MKTNSRVGQAISMIVLLTLTFMFSPTAQSNASDLVNESFYAGTFTLVGEADGMDIYSYACEGGTADHCRTTEVWVSSATNDRSRGIEIVEHNPNNGTTWLIKIGGSTVDTLPSDHSVEIPYFFDNYYTTTEISFKYINLRADDSGELYVMIGATDAEGNIIWENSKKIKKWDREAYGYMGSISPILLEADIQAITEGRPFNYVKFVENNITSAAGESYIDQISIHGFVSADQSAVDEMLNGFVPEPDIVAEIPTEPANTCPEPEIVEVEVIEYVEVIVEVPVIEYVYIDRDNGHGNDEDRFDESNPGKSKK